MKNIFISLWVVLLLFASPLASASEASVGEIASIVMHLNHYPSDMEKGSLAKIIANKHATAGEKALAGALMRMQHSVGGADAERLHSLSDDDGAAQPERELANILLGISHHPSGSDMKRLKLLAE
ncbi:MAG: hypothetical protein R8K54_00465 [Mariprofundaceae bacterium]